MNDMPDDTTRTTLAVLFAGGGSGGHIAPGLAIAERLRERDPQIRCVFGCSQRSIDRIMLEKAGAEYFALAMRPPRLSPWGFWRFIKSYRESIGETAKIIEEREIDLVVGLGGFISAPALYAARKGGVPTVLINLDDPPGKANKLCARRADRVWTAIDLANQPKFAERIVGMPLRRVAMAPGDPAFCKEALGLDPHKLVLLITGASQGASSINHFMKLLAKEKAYYFEGASDSGDESGDESGDNSGGWQIYHLAGSGDIDELRAAYRRANITAVVEPFIHEMGLAWGAADLVLSRAGAGSVAEILVNAVPAVFLPYPHHRDDHQRGNARPLEKIGGAIIETDYVDPGRNLRSVGPVLQRLMSDGARRQDMRESLRQHRPPDAAEHIAGLLIEGVDRG